MQTSGHSLRFNMDHLDSAAVVLCWLRVTCFLLYSLLLAERCVCFNVCVWLWCRICCGCICLTVDTDIKSISKRMTTARTNYFNETNNPRPELGPKSLWELSTAVINERSSGHRRWRWNHKSQMPAVLHRGLKHWKSPEVTETVIRRLVRLEQGVCWQAVPTY